MPICFHFFIVKKRKGRLVVRLQVNNERISHSCSRRYIFSSVKREGFPSELRGIFHEALHLSCSGEWGREQRRGVIMDVIGLRSDWSRLTL
jgi:hypothetical protein